MCGVLTLLCAAFLAAGLLATAFIYPFEPPGPYAAGLFTGMMLSVARIILMEKSLNRSADIGEFHGARNYGAAQVVLRNLLTLGVLVMVFFFRQVFGLFGAIIGILSIQPAALVTGYILRKDSAQI